MLVVPREGDATLVVPRLEAPRVVEQPGVFGAAPVGGDRGPDRHRRRASSAARRPPPSATRRGPASSSTCCRGCPTRGSGAPSTSSGRCGWSRTPPRSTPCVPPVPPPTGWPGSCRAARSRSSGGPRRRSRPTSRRACWPRVTTRSTSPSSPPERTPPVRTTKRADRVIARGRDRAVRLRRHDGRLLQRHHPLRLHGHGRRARSPRPTTCCTDAQQAAVAAATVGTPCQDVDRVARQIIADAGYGEYFVHRTGHGIGMDAHEDPYIVEGNEQRLVSRPRLLGRARDLRARRLGHAPRGHRRRHDRRPRAAQQLRPPPDRGLTIRVFEAVRVSDARENRGPALGQAQTLGWS